MPENAGLIEPSFRDAIAMIVASEELPREVKLHWPTSLRQFAKAMGRPLEVIPARYSAVRNDLAKWHHAPSGLSPKTVMNHRSNTKRALLYLSHEKGLPSVRCPINRGMAGADGADPRSSRPVAAFVVHSVVLGQWGLAAGGG